MYTVVQILCNNWNKHYFYESLYDEIVFADVYMLYNIQDKPHVFGGEGGERRYVSQVYTDVQMFATSQTSFFVEHHMTGQVYTYVQIFATYWTSNYFIFVEDDMTVKSTVLFKCLQHTGQAILFSFFFWNGAI